MARPRKHIDAAKLKALMRLKPSQEDVAHFFEVSTDTIERHIRREYKLSFAEFRDQNMVHTRFSLIRKALQMADSGNTAMVIFCLKNLCGWRDKHEVIAEATDEFKAMTTPELLAKVKEELGRADADKRRGDRTDAQA